LSQATLSELCGQPCYVAELLLVPGMAVISSKQAQPQEETAYITTETEEMATMVKSG